MGRNARIEALRRGFDAEERVTKWLASSGWEIVARNWTGGGGEIDVVALFNQQLRIVEVKQRAEGDDSGLESINKRKQRLLAAAAEAFLLEHSGDYTEVCFSVALVQGDRIEWIDDAF